MFFSLVDQGEETPNIKMARLRQSLTGSALETIRGLGVTEPEYEEAKEILETKFGDLVRIAVVKLQAEGQTGELGEGALHSLLVKKLADSQIKCYSCWLTEKKQERSVLQLRDWLKE